MKYFTFNIHLIHRILCFQDLDIFPQLSLNFGTNKSCLICKNEEKEAANVSENVMSKDLENKAGDNNITDEFCSDVFYNRDGVYKYKRNF